MSAKRLYSLLLGLIGLCVAVLLGGVYVANMVLQAQAKQVTSARVASQVLDQKQQQLVKEKADIAKYQSLAAIAKSIVPQDKDQAQTVREIVSIAADNNMRLGSITFPTSSLGGTGANAGKSALSQLKAVKNIPGVYSLELTIQSDTTAPVPYNQFLNFLDALEHNRRTALVSGISLQPDAIDPSKITFTLSVSEYVKP